METIVINACSEDLSKRYSRGGIVETRVIRGERGRGGKMVKVRVRYDREPVKLLFDRVVSSNPRRPLPAHDCRTD
jgi:hypothetical protein